jgi:hypothetical protein
VLDEESKGEISSEGLKKVELKIGGMTVSQSNRHSR